MPISISVASGKKRTIYSAFAEAKMKGLSFMGGCYIRKFTETTATIKLAEHKDKQLAPIRQLPPQRRVCYSIFGTIQHKPFKFTFWQKVNHLTKNISSCIHEVTDYRGSPNIANSKVRQGIEYINIP